MAQVAQPSSEFALAKKQIILGLAAVFALYFSSTYFPISSGHSQLSGQEWRQI